MKKLFEKGLSFKKLFIIFVIGSIAGVFIEEIFLFIRSYLTDYDKTRWYLDRSLVHGPFSIIYGFGMVMASVLAHLKTKNFTILFLITFILSGIVEFFGSYFQELILGTISWDYSDRFLNLGGRINFLYMLLFTIGALIYIKFVYPFLNKLLDNIPNKLFNIIYYPLLAFMIFNLTITPLAINRYYERQDGIKAENKFDELLDKYYDDDEIWKNVRKMKKTS